MRLIEIGNTIIQWDAQDSILTVEDYELHGEIVRFIQFAFPDASYEDGEFQLKEEPDIEDLADLYFEVQETDLDKVERRIYLLFNRLSKSRQRHIAEELANGTTRTTSSDVPDAEGPE